MSDALQNDDGSELPVTAVITREVVPGREADFEAWLRGVIDAVARFTGNQGVTVIRPRGKRREYVLVVRFASFRDMRRWEESEERLGWLERAVALTARTPTLHTQTGLETWFTLPDEQAPPPPPARWRMAIVTWLAIYPLIVAIGGLLGPVLEPFPFWLRPLPTTLILIPLMTWVVMPQMTKLFWRLLYPTTATRT